MTDYHIPKYLVKEYKVDPSKINHYEVVVLFGKKYVVGYVRILNIDIEFQNSHSSNLFAPPSKEVEPPNPNSFAPPSKEVENTLFTYLPTELKKCIDIELELLHRHKISDFSYKRIMHFIEYLLPFKDTDCEISSEHYELIVNEAKQYEPIVNGENQLPNGLNMQLMKSILRKLDLKRYYENAYHLICKITGNAIITLTYDTEMKLKLMFQLIQIPFHKYSYPRVNFFNYSYVLYKFFELLEMDYYSNTIKLLQNQKKLEEHDRIWEKICGELEWKFYPSCL